MQTSSSKASKSNSCLAGAVGEFFFSGIKFLCLFLFGVCSTMLPQWHLKDPGHSAKSASGRLHVNAHTPLTQPSQSGLTMQLSKYSVVTYPETSSHTTCQETLACVSQLAEALRVDPGIKSGINVRE